MAGRARRPVVVFHTVDHAGAALAAASQMGVPVTLCTAPGAAAYAGPAYLKRLAERALRRYPRAEARLLIDCGSDPATALAALRMGWRRVSFAGPREVRVKLADIAGQLGAEVTGKVGAGLDLEGSAEAEADCLAYLERFH